PFVRFSLTPRFSDAEAGRKRVRHAAETVFNGFSPGADVSDARRADCGEGRKPLETVSFEGMGRNTPLKRGVNENRGEFFAREAMNLKMRMLESGGSHSEVHGPRRRDAYTILFF